MSRRAPFLRSIPALLTLLITVALAACGGGDGTPDDTGPASGPPDAGAGTVAADGAGANGAGANGAGGEEGTGGTSQDTARGAGEAAQAPDRPWSAPPIRGVPAGSGRGAALLRSVRTGRHAGYDRIVFEFEEHLPEYTIRYLQDPTACGSGHRVDAGGAASLEIDLRPAAAHDDQGRPTVADRDRSPGLPVLQAAQITCDFEGIVAWVLGLEYRAGVRVLELGSPARLVVDLRHR